MRKECDVIFRLNDWLLAWLFSFIIYQLTIFSLCTNFLLSLLSQPYWNVFSGPGVIASFTSFPFLKSLAIANEKLRLYGVQFHPEVDLTPNGRAMMRNFLYDVVGLKGNFTMQSRELECIEYIKKEVGNSKVLVS